jgi:hypothetical protein
MTNLIFYNYGWKRQYVPFFISYLCPLIADFRILRIVTKSKRLKRICANFSSSQSISNLDLSDLICPFHHRIIYGFTRNAVDLLIFLERQIIWTKRRETMTLFDLRFLAVMNFRPPWPSDCILFLLVESAMSRGACESVSPNMVSIDSVCMCCVRG